MIGRENIERFFIHALKFVRTVKLGDKERFDKEQIGAKEPFLMINLPFTS